MSFIRFKEKQGHIFGLALIDTGNLVHSAIVLGEFWEVIGGKLSKSMDCKVGTADGQSDGLQVLGIGEPGPIYLEDMVYPRTVSNQRTESQCKSRNILLDGAQPEDQLHGRRWVNIQSSIGRRRIS